MPENSSPISGATKPPQYRRMKRGKGRPDSAVCYVDGKRVLLGKWGSAESKAKFAELVEVKTTEPTDCSIEHSPPTVNELIVAYLEHAATYYRDPDGKPTSEYTSIKTTATWLRRDAGPELAKEFGPKRLKLLREKMIAERWVRKTVNDAIKRIQRMFRWAASEEMVDPSVTNGLDTVVGLRAGRSAAKESDPVQPVSDADVEATLKKLPKVVADMVRVQRFTGMRAGEMIIMRPRDIDRSGKVWLYVPRRHKTQHHGHNRIVAIGPQCQAVLLLYLARGADDFCFQPRDSEAKRSAVRLSQRVTPMSCGNKRGSNRLADPKTKPGDRYTTDSYRRAITRAAVLAGVDHWNPHRLRHSAGTEARKAFGLEGAQCLLGHRNAKVTEIYAELNTARAAEVALKIG